MALPASAAIILHMSSPEDFSSSPCHCDVGETDSFGAVHFVAQVEKTVAGRFQRRDAVDRVSAIPCPEIRLALMRSA
jgi:hypothetical protein